MIPYRKFHVPVNNLMYEADFGIADVEEEVQGIYRLRYEIIPTDQLTMETCRAGNQKVLEKIGEIIYSNGDEI